MAYKSRNYIYNNQLTSEENLLLDRLYKLRMAGMAEALEKQYTEHNYALEDFWTHLAEIINYEWEQRQTK